MTLEKDYYWQCYVIRITREEVKRMYLRAYENAKCYGRTEDELVAKELCERLLCLINSDMRDKTDADT